MLYLFIFNVVVNCIEMRHSKKNLKKSKTQTNHWRIECGCVFVTAAYLWSIERHCSTYIFVECFKNMWLANAYGKRHRLSWNTIIDNNKTRHKKETHTHTHWEELKKYFWINSYLFMPYMTMRSWKDFFLCILRCYFAVIFTSSFFYPQYISVCMLAV